MLYFSVLYLFIYFFFVTELYFRAGKEITFKHDSHHEALAYPTSEAALYDDDTQATDDVIPDCGDDGESLNDSENDCADEDGSDVFTAHDATQQQRQQLVFRGVKLPPLSAARRVEKKRQLSGPVIGVPDDV